MTLAELRCDACGSSDIFALDPGFDPVRSDVPLFDVLLDAGQPSVGRCHACFFAKFGRREVAR
jgi:hypothetical protein